MARLKKKSYSDGSLKGWQMVLDDKTLYDGSKTIFYSVHEYKESDVEKRLLLVRDIESTMKKRGKLTEDIEEELRRFPDLHHALIEKGVVQSAPVITLGELFKRYLDDGAVKESTFEIRRGRLRRALDLIGDRIALDVDERVALDFDAQLNKLVELWKRDEREGYAPATRAGYVKTVKTAFNWAVQKGLLPDNPFKGIKAGSQVNRSRLEYITPKESEKILEACLYSNCPNEWRALFALARFQGFRTPSEQRELHWRDVDFEKGMLTFYAPKTDSWRTMPILPDTTPILKELFDERNPKKDDFVFQCVSVRNPRTTYEKIIKRAGVERYPRLFQNLRASAASDIANKYGSPAESAWVGHTEKIATAHYIKVTPDIVARAKEESLFA